MMGWMASMNEITTVGLDLAKNVFQVARGRCRGNDGSAQAASPGAQLLAFFERHDGTRGLARPKLSPHRQRRPLLCNRFEVVSYGRVGGVRRTLLRLVSQSLVKVRPLHI
jgi:hypothetical protein